MQGTIRSGRLGPTAAALLLALAAQAVVLLAMSACRATESRPGTVEQSTSASDSYRRAMRRFLQLDAMKASAGYDQQQRNQVLAELRTDLLDLHRQLYGTSSATDEGEEAKRRQRALLETHRPTPNASRNVPRTVSLQADPSNPQTRATMELALELTAEAIAAADSKNIEASETKVAELREVLSTLSRSD
jgi:hypothetical protein